MPASGSPVEARAVLAPLANRLGVWQLKWELEDLCLPASGAGRIQAHRRRALNERRADRERYIEEVCEILRSELEKGRVKAQVYGRPKHIYSIYRKMQRKHLAFEEVFDVRAVRIVVDSVPECYAALRHRARVVDVHSRRVRRLHRHARRAISTARSTPP